MSDSLLSLFMAAGITGWVYTKMSRRLGAGNNRNLWMVLGVCFVVVFAFFWTTLRYVVHLH